MLLVGLGVWKAGGEAHSEVAGEGVGKGGRDSKRASSLPETSQLDEEGVGLTPGWHCALRPLCHAVRTGVLPRGKDAQAESSRGFRREVKRCRLLRPAPEAWWSETHTWP